MSSVVVVPRISSLAMARGLSNLPTRRVATQLLGSEGASSFSAALARSTSRLRQSLPSTELRRPAAAAAAVQKAGYASVDLPFSDVIESAARSARIDPALVAAVAHAESGFNPRAQSEAGAKGLMQLMDSTARGLGVQDSFDPAQNVKGGATFLAGLLKQFHGDVKLALAAYNAGPGAVQRYGGIPPYEETQRYVPKVLTFYEQYRRRWSAASVEADSEVPNV